MEAKEFKTSEGTCIISGDVIASIAATAASEVPGVASLASRPADLRGIVSTTQSNKSVRVMNTENETVLDVYVDLQTGAKIQETASQIQQSVKIAVQSMTGKPVTRVNVHIEGMVSPEDKK
ncbi:MAG: Asp23/Gls24 family envelope stress response protein [Ruminococcaceae bacterium]|nr:Asp23/Gls24 family envelope stress response protein [Oscillospiraceae bacterium]